MKRLTHLRYRLEALASATPSLYLVALRKLASPDALKLFCARTLRKGDIVFDVGANRGLVTSYCSNLVGPTGKVHAFEPSGATCSLLNDSIAARTLHDNIILNQTAVGDQNGTIVLRTPAGDDGQASVVEHKAGSWSGHPHIATEECRMIRLDSYIESNDVSQLDFVKIDVEGAERLVIEGFRIGLRSLLPIVELELFSAWTIDFGYHPADVIDSLRELGYDSFQELTSDGCLAPMRSTQSLNNSGESFDVVCSVQTKHGSRLRTIS